MPEPIPKCVGCSFHEHGSEHYELKRHWCHHLEAKGYCFGVGAFVKASEAKTSPKWCPKREKQVCKINKEMEGA